MPYIHSRPTVVSFTGKGLLGYTFGPVQQKDVEVYYIEVAKGHDFYMISKAITRTYYVLSGTGHFTIENQRYDVSAGMLVEVPPKVEYCYSGTMTLIAFSKPRWFRGNDKFTKWNPDVVGHSTALEDNASWLASLVRWKVLGKSPVRAYLRLNQRVWESLPASFISLPPVRFYGDFVHKLARLQGDRAQAFSTLFVRNRPQLELIRRLARRMRAGEALRVALLGCSTGAEAYSVAWTILSERPDLEFVLDAMDISSQAVEFAEKGVYSLAVSELTNTHIFENVTPAEMRAFFDRDGDAIKVKARIKQRIRWLVGDAGDRDAIDSLGPHDIVIANNFLCHMEPPEAEQCLRSIARCVRPDGYLFVSGVDLDVRTKVACDSGWEPVEELLEEMHEGDSYMRSYWPGQYAGLEPLNKRKRDWKIRYAAVFHLLRKPSTVAAEQENALCKA